MDDLSEHQIVQLLRTADRPRPLSERELERLERTLDLHPHDPPHPKPTEVVSLPAAEPDRAGVRRRGPASAWIGACAAAFVAVLVVALTMLDRPPGTAPGESPTQPVPPAPTAWCIDHIVPVIDAVERWRGVENWAWAAGGVPDLGELVTSALLELTLSGDPDTVDAARAVGAELRDELDAAADSTDFRDAARRRLVAVESALDTLTALGRATDPVCPFDSLAAARGS